MHTVAGSSTGNQQRQQTQGRTLDALERDVVHLYNTVEDDRRDRRVWQSQIEDQINNLGRSLGARLDQVASSMADRNRTPWGVIWSALGVGVLALATVGSMALVPMRIMDSRFEKQLDNLAEHHRAHTTDGHPQRVEERLDLVQAEIKENREQVLDKLYREVGLLAEQVEQASHTQEKLLEKEAELRRMQAEAAEALASTRLQWLQAVAAGNAEDTAWLERRWAVPGWGRKYTPPGPASSPAPQLPAPGVETDPEG